MGLEEWIMRARNARKQAEGKPAPHEVERGSGTILALGLALVILVILVLAVAVAAIMGAVLAQHRASTAADLAALAAADTARGLRDGEPCVVAARIASENDAELIECALPQGYSGTVDVRVQVPIRGVLAVVRPAEGLSRAGPPQRQN